jgi:hypothetical protein
MDIINSKKTTFIWNKSEDGINLIVKDVNIITAEKELQDEDLEDAEILPDDEEYENGTGFPEEPIILPPDQESSILDEDIPNEIREPLETELNPEDDFT